MELYDGDLSGLTEVITTGDVLRMVRDEPSLLPARIRAWFAIASS